MGKLREVPGVFSQGEALEELEENIRDAYDLTIGVRGGGLIPASAFCFICSFGRGE